MDRFPKRTPNIGEPIFEVKNWVVHHAIHPDRQMIKGINLTVKKGEIVGIAGLMGAGRTEFAMSVFGRSYGRRISGEVFLHGKKIDVSTIGKAVDHGIAYVTEDRKTYGLNLIDHIKHNITIVNLKGVSKVGVIDDLQELGVANEYRAKTNIRSSNVYQLTGNLSGGNQQKVVLSKWLFANPEILILDEPTRGIDVGAKYEIYTIIGKLASEGKGVIVISSEMPELLGISDRIYVMNDGKLVSEMLAKDASQEKIMRAILRADTKLKGRMSTQVAVLSPPPEPKPAKTTGHGNFREYGLMIALGRDHDLLPVHDERHVVQAAQPDQSGPSEQLCHYHGAGDAASHCRRLH